MTNYLDIDLFVYTIYIYFFNYRVGVIKMELAQQIKADFEESFQGPNAKVFHCLISNNFYLVGCTNSGSDVGIVTVLHC